MFMLSDSPPEKEIKWTEQGIAGSYKFIQKFWILHEKIKQKREIKPVMLIITTCPDTTAPIAANSKPAKPTNSNLQVIKKAAILASLV